MAERTDIETVQLTPLAVVTVTDDTNKISHVNVQLNNETRFSFNTMKRANRK